VVTEDGTTLGEPFTAGTDEAAFAALDAHVEALGVPPDHLVGIEVLVGATWLEAGLWREPGEAPDPGNTHGRARAGRRH
jgi:hypothetical protein